MKPWIITAFAALALLGTIGALVFLILVIKPVIDIMGIDDDPNKSGQEW